MEAVPKGVRHRSRPLPALWPVSERAGGYRVPPRAPGQRRGPRAASAGPRQALPSPATAMPGALTGRYRARPVVVGAERDLCRWRSARCQARARSQVLGPCKSGDRRVAPVALLDARANRVV